MKGEVDKLDIDTLTYVSTSLNNLKAKVNDLDVGKLKTCRKDLKKLSNIVESQLVKNTKFNTLKTKANISQNKILDATTLIHIN